MGHTIVNEKSVKGKRRAEAGGHKRNLQNEAKEKKIIKGVEAKIMGWSCNFKVKMGEEEDKNKKDTAELKKIRDKRKK